MTSESGIASAAEAIADEADESAAKPDSPTGKLPSAITALLSARIAIISSEAKHAVTIVGTKVLWAIIAACCAAIFFLLLIAGLIGLISNLSGLAWFYVALIMAAVFLLVVILAVSFVRRQTDPVFSITRSEFEKDQKWLASIKTKSTSKS